MIQKRETDNALIDEAEDLPTPSHQGSSGGDLAREVGQRDEDKTATGEEGLVIDLTDKLSGDMTQNKTIYGAIVMTEEYSVFVKAMGEFQPVIKQKPVVLAFCKSLRIERPKT